MILEEKNIFQQNQLPLLPHSFIQLFSPQLNDQTDSDSIINTVFFHCLSQDDSRDMFFEHKNTDAEKFKNEVINIFIQTDFDNS